MPLQTELTRRLGITGTYLYTPSPSRPHENLNGQSVKHSTINLHLNLPRFMLLFIPFGTRRFDSVLGLTCFVSTRNSARRSGWHASKLSFFVFAFSSLPNSQTHKRRELTCQQHVGTAELASAVSNAGGLGIITALIFPEPEGLRQEIRKCKKLTTRPFAVNITLLPALVPPDYEAYAQVVIDEGLKIVETAGNSPGPVISKLKKAGVIILHKCTTIRHAQSAVKLGVDFLSIDGFECAG